MFIEKTDYGASIQSNILDDIVESDDDLISQASRAAISLMKGYLNARYDVNAIFNATGLNRHETILSIGLDLAIYDLHARINPRKIPTFRKEKNAAAKEWLMDVSEGIINPPDLPLVAEGAKDYMRFGSNPKRDNHI